MTEETTVQLDIEYLKATAAKGAANQKDSEWRKAFDFYNKANSQNEVSRMTKLGMGCAPCYHKVLMFVFSVYQAQQENKKVEIKWVK